jgi:hypothetical protein
MYTGKALDRITYAPGGCDEAFLQATCEAISPNPMKKRASDEDY